MKILLLSDTHGYWEPEIEKYTKDCDEIWHAGDIGTFDVLEKLSSLKPVVAVYGNIDGRDIRSETKKHQIFSRESLMIFMTHIGGYPGRYNPLARKVIDSVKPKLFICGHSHILKVVPDKRRGLLHMNPGAMGKHGIHLSRTMIRFSIENGVVKSPEVIEFKRK